jgi:VWFA-related protein
MNRYPIALVFALAAVAALAQQTQEKPSPPPSPAPQASGDSPTFPAQVEVVTVDAVVTDKKGSPIKGLTKDDFVLTEDGQRQAIVSFEAVEAPAAPAATPPALPRVSTNTRPEVSRGHGRTFVILFDDVHLTQFQARRAKGAVAEFLKNGVREGDRVTLISSGGDAWWTSQMEAGREVLMTLLKRLEGRHIPDIGNDRMSDYEAMRIHVYGDPQVQERVLRRWDSYGVPNASSGVRGQDGTNATGDPFIRGKASEVYYQSTARSRITLAILERVLQSLATTRGRKSLILVSEGFIYDSNLDEFKSVIQASRRSNCAIYFVDSRGLGGMPEYFTAAFGPPIDSRDVGFAFAETLEASEGSESLASDSGGFSVRNTNDLAKGIQRIADETRIYYLLGYNPTNTVRDGRFRKIKVEVARKGVEVRARKGYYAPLEGEAKARAEKKEKKGEIAGDPRFQEAVDSPYEMGDVPMRMTAYVFEETLLGKARVLVAADVDVNGFAFEEKDGRFVDTAEFLLVAAHRETGEYFRYDQKVEMKLLPETKQKVATSWLPVVREFELAPGGYQAKIVVRDKNSGKIGTLIHEFEVPELSQLRISGPVLSDVLRPNSDDAKATPQPTPLARRAFAPGATLYCQYEVFGATKDKATAMPKVTAGYVVKKVDGAVLTQMEPSIIKPTSIGRLSRLIGTPLNGAAPGSYEVVLTLKDELSGKTIEIREPFVVESSS